jgi:WD40 repeat protein
MTAVATSTTLPLLVTGDNQGTATAWNVSDPIAPTRVDAPLLRHTKVVTQVAFSRNGNLLGIASDDGTVDLYRVSAPAHIEQITTTTVVHEAAEINSLDFSADGALLAVGLLNSTIGLWDVSDPAHPTRTIEPVRAHKSGVDTVRFSPKGSVLATGGGEDGVLLWDLADPHHPRRLTDALPGYPDGVKNLLFTPDGTGLITTTPDDSLVRWNVTKPRHPMQIGTPTTGTGGITRAAAVTSDGRYLVLGGSTGVISLWDTAVTPPLKADPPFIGASNDIYDLTLSRDGRVAYCAGADGQVTVWRVRLPTQPDRVVQTSVAHSQDITAVAAAPDGSSFVTGAADGTAMIWQSRPNEPAVQAHSLVYDAGDSPRVLAYSPDSRILAIGSERGRLSLIDVSDPRQPRLIFAQPAAHAGVLYALSFAPSGQLLASGGEDGKIRLWTIDADRVQPVLTALNAYTQPVTTLAFTDGGRVLLSGAIDGQVGEWDVPADPAASRNLGFWRGHTDIVNGLAFVTYQRFVSVGDDGRVVVWTLDPAFRGVHSTLSFPQTQSAPPIGVTTLAGGRLLAVAKLDGKVTFWDMDDPEQPWLLLETVLLGPTSHFASMAPLDDSELLVSSIGGSPTIWNISGLLSLMDEAKVRSSACAAAGGGLDQAEWQRVVPELPFVTTC